MWDEIEEAIIEAANKQVPRKKIFNTKANRRLSQKKSQQYKQIMKLQQIIKKAKKKKDQEAKEEERIKVNNKLKVIKKEIEATLLKLHRQWSEA